MRQVFSRMYFKITLLLEVQGWLKATPLQQGPFHSSLWTYLLLLWGWKIYLMLSRLLLSCLADMLLVEPSITQDLYPHEMMLSHLALALFQKTQRPDWLNSQGDEEGGFDPDEDSPGLTVSPSAPDPPGQAPGLEELALSLSTPHAGSLRTQDSETFTTLTTTKRADH